MPFHSTSGLLTVEHYLECSSRHEHVLHRIAQEEDDDTRVQPVIDTPGPPVGLRGHEGNDIDPQEDSDQDHHFHIILGTKKKNPSRVSVDFT